jgi:hypothetical protein
VQQQKKALTLKKALPSELVGLTRRLSGSLVVKRPVLSTALTMDKRVWLSWELRDFVGCSCCMGCTAVRPLAVQLDDRTTPKLPPKEGVKATAHDAKPAATRAAALIRVWLLATILDESDQCSSQRHFFLQGWVGGRLGEADCDCKQEDRR